MVNAISNKSLHLTLILSGRKLRMQFNKEDTIKEVIKKVKNEYHDKILGNVVPTNFSLKNAIVGHKIPKNTKLKEITTSSSTSDYKLSNDTNNGDYVLYIEVDNPYNKDTKSCTIL